MNKNLKYKTDYLKMTNRFMYSRHYLQALLKIQGMKLSFITQGHFPYLIVVCESTVQSFIRINDIVL